GPDGLAAIARRVHRLTAILKAGLVKGGFVVPTAAFFDTLTVATRDDVARILHVFHGDDPALTVEHLDKAAPSAIPPALARTSAYLAHPVFHRYRTETEMLRYLRRLADKDLALDRAMIPLGSCTMKLNATAEMIPVTWPAFCDLH